jgi:hypothetical protein
MALTRPPRLQEEDLLLPSPFAYIVSFTLSGPIGAYEDFFRELQQCDNWLNYIPGFWIVITRLSLVDLAERLRKKIRTGDWLIVMPAKGPADGWLPKVAWEWINNNVPREW